MRAPYRMTASAEWGRLPTLTPPARKVNARGTGIVTLILLASMAQSPVSPTPGSVSGRVIHALTREPLRGAIVVAGRARAGVSRAEPDAAFLTNADGVFVLRGLPQGPLNLTASKAGYLDAHYAAAVAAGPGERLDGIVVALTPSSLISGRVLDPAGDPVSQAAVRVAPEGEPLTSRAARSTTSDDQGWYVIDKLAAGDYVLGAARSVAESLEIPEARLVAVAIEAGKDQPGVDLPVPDPNPAASYPIGPGGQRVSAAQAAGGSASIAGTVRTVHGRGLPNVIVFAGRDEGGSNEVRPWVTRTDERGGFLIQNLPAGSFRVLALRAGDWAMAFGSTRPNQPGKAVRLTAGQLQRDVDIVLREAGAISGTIRDEFGDPVRAMVSLVAADPVRGISSIVTRSTDDRGRYRLGSLPPRAYLVMAVRDTSMSLRAQDGSGVERAIGASAVFYPGVPSPWTAAVLQIDSGTELQGIDLVASHAPVARVELSVIAPGLPVESLEARPFPLDTVFPVTGSNRTRENALIFDAVPAGRWLFVASARVATSGGQEKYWASQEVTSDGLTPQTATLTLEPGARLSGRFVFDGNGQPPATTDVWLTPAWRPPAGPILPPDATTQTDADGFRLSNVMPGRYVIHAADRRDDGAWTLKRATSGAQDVLDLPIELVAGSDLSGLVLTLTDRQTELSGTVTDAAGRPLAETDIVIAPADARHHWPGSRRLRSATTGHDGTYQVRGLPSGDYQMGLLPAPSLGSSLIVRPGALAAATAVTLTEGEKKVQNLVIARLSPR